MLDTKIVVYVWLSGRKSAAKDYSHKNTFVYSHVDDLYMSVVTEKVTATF